MTTGRPQTFDTPWGMIEFVHTAQKCLIGVNAYGGTLEPVSAAHIMPIGSFIGATVPLGVDSKVLPGGDAYTYLPASVRRFPVSRRTPKA